MPEPADSEDFQGGRVLVPLSDSIYLRKTVSYAMENYSNPSFVAFVSDDGDVEVADDLANKVDVWASEARADEDAGYTVEVEETERYLFSPTDYAEVFHLYCRRNAVDTVLLDPEYKMDTASLVLGPLQNEIENMDLSVQIAPVRRAVRRRPLLTRGGATRFAAIFVMSYVFYLIVGTLGVFDIVTGAATALVVAAALYKVGFDSTPEIRRFPVLFARFSLYTPYLMWQMFKANVQIAYVTLHPKLPIDPEIIEFEAQVWGGFPISTLANSITLTPGTLTVEADGRTLHVHALTDTTKQDLLDGGLERAVRFVFYGRSQTQPKTPRKRRKERREGE